MYKTNKIEWVELLLGDFSCFPAASKKSVSFLKDYTLYPVNWLLQLEIPIHSVAKIAWTRSRQINNSVASSFQNVLNNNWHLATFLISLLQMIRSNHQITSHLIFILSRLKIPNNSSDNERSRWPSLWLDKVTAECIWDSSFNGCRFNMSSNNTLLYLVFNWNPNFLNNEFTELSRIVYSYEIFPIFEFLNQMNIYIRGRYVA